MRKPYGRNSYTPPSPEMVESMAAEAAAAADQGADADLREFEGTALQGGNLRQAGPVLQLRPHADVRRESLS